MTRKDRPVADNVVNRALCWILGHEWKGTGQIDRYCLRCNRYESFLDQPVPKRPRPCPASATRPDVYVEVVGPGGIVRCPSCGRKTHMTHLGYLYPHMAIEPNPSGRFEDTA
jgi:hypothetical protein